MPSEIYNITSITQMHECMGWAKPKHPLVSIVEAEKLAVPAHQIGSRVVSDLYMVSLKDKNCGIQYGRRTFDFNEGVMIFSAPKQITKVTQAIQLGDIHGWILYFHPDLIHGTNLGQQIGAYTFFDYEVFEALHLSEDEERTITECIFNIKKEYEQRIDNHSHRVMVSNLELLLNYCLRFYERQFNTRKKQNTSVLVQFEKELKSYFSAKIQEDNGLPTIQYMAEKVNLSAHYLSDLLKKETGRSAKDHINDYVISRAKNLLLGSPHSISEIAYQLGFNYPHYFTRLFKSKTGQTPLEYRSVN